MPRGKMPTPIEKIDREIADLQHKREILLEYFPNGTRLGRPKASAPKASTKRVDTVETMKTLVKERKRPLSIDEFYEGLTAKGWKSSNKEPKKTIWAAIGRGGFKKTKPGFYGVKA